MILRKPDGITLYYTTQEGVEVSANPIQWQRYSELLKTLDAQAAAVQVNTQNLSKYMSDLHDYQVMVDTKGQAAAGRAPAKPLMKVISDTNEATFPPFPSLPDPVYPVVSPSAPIGPDAHNAPLDPVTQMILSTLMALHAKVDRLLSKAGA